MDAPVNDKAQESQEHADTPRIERFAGFSTDKIVPPQFLVAIIGSGNESRRHGRNGSGRMA
ncbi:hypothetical protein PUN4_250013 [Paraburkholderia unamae]|nr:hypothetical protein PUN4_250013 [Paraburkholderia unamae]